MLDGRMICLIDKLTWYIHYSLRLLRSTIKLFDKGNLNINNIIAFFDRTAEMSKEEDNLSSFDETETETESEDLDPPSEFICGLTMEIMHDPLMSRYGHNYERAAIVEWLTRGNDTCPMTRRPMKLCDLISNHHLRTRIDEWKEEHRDGVSPILVEMTSTVPQCFGIINLDSQERPRRRSSSSIHHSARRRRREQGSSERRPNAARQNVTSAQPTEALTERTRRGASVRFMKRFFSGRGVSSHDGQAM